MMNCRGRMTRGANDVQTAQLRRAIDTADAVLIGAGAGLSTSAGFTYSGERFNRWFSDFAQVYGFDNMYTGGFYPFPSKEQYWAYWARYIYINRYMDAPKSVYSDLLALVEGRDYFILTTNVDHAFQKAGFDKTRLFYTQGDYGLFQSVHPANQRTYDNEAWVLEAMAAQGFIRGEDGCCHMPADGEILMQIPTDLLPKCPDGQEAVMNLRADETFVEDEGWKRAAKSYADYIEIHKDDHVLYLELGVGANTPGIIKYPFWQMVLENENAAYACVNFGEAFCPMEIAERSIVIDGDIGEVLCALR